MPYYSNPGPPPSHSQGKRFVQVKREALSGCFIVEAPQARAMLLYSKARCILARKNIGNVSNPQLKLQSGNFIVIEENADGLDGIIRIGNIIQRATEVFGSREKAQHWLSKPKSIFYETSPLQYSQTEEGATFVLDVLGRIEHGVFS